MMQKHNHKNSQEGSVLFYILLAVLLFAALSFTVSNMMRSGADPGAEKKALIADEIMSYARTVRQAVQVLRVTNECGDAQFSFERSPFDGSDSDYVNAAAPLDFTCHVFHPKGGGVGYQTASTGNDWFFTSEFYIDDVGSGESEISAVLRVERDVCLQINKKLNIEGADLSNYQDDGSGAGGELSAFDGAFTGSGEVLEAVYKGKMTGCYKSVNTSAEEYSFYQVLLAR